MCHTDVSYRVIYMHVFKSRPYLLLVPSFIFMCHITINLQGLEYKGIIIQTSAAKQLQIFTIYQPPQSTSLQQFVLGITHLLQTVTPPTIILGVFNEDLLGNHPTLIRDLEEHQFHQKLQPTTDYGSQLDHLYHNIPNIHEECQVIDTYYSDHDITIADILIL